MKIHKVVVIGSGTMGSGIAAHLCNANISVTLLDLKTEISEKARDKIFNSRPPLLLDKSKINNIKVGNINDDLNVLKNADWIVEAVVERIDIKHNIYEKIFRKRKPGAIVSSNTSSIPIKILSKNLTDDQKKDFCITHFFNPVRYMGLLEIVKNENNDLEKINSLKKFCEEELGKGAIVCNDTPGFLGNRVGVYAMQIAMTEAFKMKLSIEEADAVFGRPMGIPKTGVFGLYDLIGIDLMADVLKSFIKELPKDDPFHEVAQENPLITKLISDGYTGRKSKGGFYRINKEGEKKVLESINLKTGEYSKTKKVDLETETLDFIYLINRIDKFGEYAWSVLSKIILYASSLIPKVTDEYNNIDEAMRLGFNWTIGPFEILDKIGIEFFAERDQNLKLNRFLNNLYLNERIDWYSDKQLYLKHDLRTLRRRSNIYWLKADVKKNENLIFNSAKIYTSETEGYNIVEFTTKANTLDSDSMYALSKATEKNLIIINDALQFSAGVNLNYVMEFAKQKEWRKIQKFIFDFQQTCKKLKYSEFPVIAAPSGLAIGGGFEVVCQSDYVVSHTNVVLGLVETLVGLIPAGGGCKEMLWRWMQTDESKKDLNFAPLKVFDLIGYAKTASSPNEAIPNKFLLDKDRVVINRDRLLHESEKLLLQIKKDYKPPAEPTFKLSGANVRDKMYEILETLYKDKKILDHGLEVGKQLAFVLSGGNTNLDKELSEDDLYALELDAFMNLIQMPKTQERIKHTLETGKPLVN